MRVDDALFDGADSSWFEFLLLGPIGRRATVDLHEEIEDCQFLTDLFLFRLVGIFHEGGRLVFNFGRLFRFQLE